MRKFVLVPFVSIALAATLVNCSDDDGTGVGTTTSSSSGGSSSSSSGSSGIVDAGPKQVTVGGNVTGLLFVGGGDAGIVDASTEGGAKDSGGDSGGDAAADAGRADAGAPASLVLQNNGSDDVMVAKNGPFTFAKPQSAGTPYVVAVKTQPAGHTCTVTKGAGTAAANISDVAVACTQNDYEVTVDVAGLNGKGLAVELNGADTTTITANGAKKFLVKVKYGSAYAVTVKTQPSFPTAKCVIAPNGAGTMLGNTTVAVTCADDVLPNATYTADKTFVMNAGDIGAAEFVTALAFDGTSYWVAGLVQSTVGSALTKFDAAFVLQQRYPIAAPYTITGLFSPGGNGAQLSAYEFSAQNTISNFDGMGVRSNRTTLMPATAAAVTWPVFNNGATEILAHVGAGRIQRWDATTGAALTDITLVGYGDGSVPEETGIEWNKHVFASSGYLITVAGNRISVWNATTGARIKSADLDFVFDATANTYAASVAASYCNGRFWMYRTASTGAAAGTWLGYDIGL
jgi:hypothetical protein